MSGNHPSGTLTRNAALASVAVALLLIGLKGFAAFETGSVAMLGSLADSFEHVVVTASRSDRSIEQAELAAMAEKYWPGQVTTSGGVALAMQVAREIATRDEYEAIVITGSLSVVGEALKTIQEENNED